MLAQNFKSAADLEITEPQLDALRKTLVLLETGKLEYAPIRDRDIGGDPGKTFDGKFNMAAFNIATECGTVMCICGTAEMIGEGVEFGNNWTRGIDDLFRPKIGPKKSSSPILWRQITTDQAAIALRSYLTTGEARWDLAVGEASGLHPDR